MYADVLIQYSVKALDRTFTYAIPTKWQGIIERGMKVSIPFGNQEINGFVLKVHDNKPDNPHIEIKEIKDVINRDFKLNDELMALGTFIKEKTLCSQIAAYQTILPTILKVNKSKEDYSMYQTFISLAMPQEEIDAYIRSHPRSSKINEVLTLLSSGPQTKKDLPAFDVNKLVNLGLIKVTKESVYRINPISLDNKEKELTPEQKDVFNILCAGLDKAQTYLLHGVTGSGKTEIYMQVVKEVLNRRRQVIMLVPEISLTTQIVRRFYNRFGARVAVFHSGLSDGEKYDEYQKILKKEVDIVVGTRSSIFVPFTNIGAIIIDEEHSGTYKQENMPCYNAKDIAEWRSKYHHCPLILGSATPCLETMARALKGVYYYLPLNKRIGSSKLPTIEIVDMAQEYRRGNMILSESLQFKIMETLQRHEQVMLLLNRRGYSTIISCQSCGFTYKCPNCDISLTYHKSTNNLRCHYCGYTTAKASFCPACKEKAISEFGLGTEKVEQYLRELYPSYRLVRMDTDTTSRKGTYDKIITAIENLEYDIIIGTQMISKGFDFPRVTLVGIINADESLNIPDFRSGENTFNLLSQVSGRAGRSELAGNVVIQTFNPENKTLQFVQHNDYRGNYDYEMSIRKMLKYPPYYYLVCIGVTSKKYDILSKEVTKVINYLRKHIAQDSICLGPTPANPFRVNNVYRFQIIIKYRFDNQLYPALNFLDEEYALNKEVNLEIDINPLRF